MEKGIFDSKVQITNEGIKLITIKKDTQLASIHIGFNIGSLYETKDNRGICHFIEHMLFKGTSNRDNIRLNNDLEQLGGEYNAYTNYNSTVFSITALHDELENSIEILSDMVKNASFPEEEIDKERGVILAEIRTSKDDLEDYSFRKVNEIAFKKSPLRYDTLGEERTVKSFNRQKLVDYYRHYYIPNNCYISIVSPYNHSEITAMVEKYLGDWKAQTMKLDEVLIEKNIPTKQVSYKKEIEQSTIVYAFTFHGLDRKEELALKILNHRFGESANSILFRELREEKGLVYDIYSDIDLTSYVKTLYIYTAVSNESVDEAVQTIDACMDRIKNEEIKFDEGTISLMRKVLKTAVAATLEDSTDLSNYVLHQLIDGESVYEFLEDMKNIEDVTAEDIYNTARKVFTEPTIHILIPEAE